MAEGMVSSGLRDVGFKHIWIDDGWAIGRDNKSGTCTPLGPTGADSCKPIVDPVLFPSGMRNLSDFLHNQGLKFGIYTSKGPLTCLGYQPTQPNRPGSCGYEKVDADTYVNDWQVDQVKDDGCGGCPQHEPFAAMRDALNSTGKPIWYAIHSQTVPGSPNATVANMWRTGGDLSSSSFDMWTNRLDLATTTSQRALAGKGAFPNPDFLEVGYSPRNTVGRTQTDLEQRSMFTMWAALPGPLILSADLRPKAPCGGIDGKYTMQTLTNKEIIAINQDPLANPLTPVRRNGTEVWKKAVSDGLAVVFFNRNTSSVSPGVGAVAMNSPCHSPVNLRSDAGMLKLMNSSVQLCLGSIGTCQCSNPRSPQMGIVPCNTSDNTQTWRYDASVNQFMNDASHTLNSGPTCPGDVGNSMLLYINQNSSNEKYKYDPTSGLVESMGGGDCLGIPTPSGGSSQKIAVTWSELGLSMTQKVTVRDLWSQTDVGDFTGSFSADIQWHEARIYLLKTV